MHGPLDIEATYYQEREAELRELYFGRFVLIKGREIIGAYPTALEAHAAGFQRFRYAPFLIQYAGPGRPPILEASRRDPYRVDDPATGRYAINWQHNAAAEPVKKTR
ncbi:MAG TPA: hypothetical protein VEI94_07730 [Candidatus Bathyarchaeia archaeon]|nr:hypothetical protein [Candidatus Bathyarchaeia archaeon]